MLGSTRLWLGWVACGLLCGSLLAVGLTSKKEGMKEVCEECGVWETEKERKKREKRKVSLGYDRNMRSVLN